jgi:lysophospholipase
MLGLADSMAPAYARPVVDMLRLAGLGRMFVPGGGPRSISMKPFENNRLSSDHGRYERNAAVLTAAPYLAIGDPTVSWLAGAFRLMAAVTAPALAPKLATPLLVLASGADRVVSTAVTERFAARLKLGAAIVINGARHELLMEADIYRDQALAALDAFLPGVGTESLPGKSESRLFADGVP